MSLTKVFSGDSIILKYNAVDEYGAVLNLTGGAIKWQLARNASDTPLLTKTIGAGVTVTNAAGGLFEVKLSFSETRTLGPGNFYHEVEHTTASGDKYTIFNGAMVLARKLIA